MKMTNDCEEIEEYEEIDDTKIEPQITHSEALNSCKKLINYLEQQSDNFSSCISSLYNLKQKIEQNQENPLKKTSILDYFQIN